MTFGVKTDGSYLFVMQINNYFHLARSSFIKLNSINILSASQDLHLLK